MITEIMIPALSTVLLALVVGAGSASAQSFSSDHPGQYTQDEITAGSRVYSAQCQFCHGRDGDQVSGIDLRRGVFRQALDDAGLARVIRSGTQAGMPPFTLADAELTGIIAFMRAAFDGTASIVVGDAARGKELFDGKGACASCHRVGPAGPLVAPPLNDIGLARTPAALERSIRDPSSAMLPINRPVRIAMRDGSIVSGRRLNEDTATVQIIDDSEQLRSIAKGDMRSMDVATASPMPAYAERLTEAEIGDLVGYLLTLRTR
jgi:cytochrome c oxidase cbb3-type subunit III